jgi:hypothetical protein
MTRKCSTCSTVKNLEEFDFRSKNQNARQYSCKICSNERSKRHYQNNRVEYLKRRKQRKIKNQIWMLNYLKKNPCECGEDHPAALDFDHIKNKKFNISRALINGASLKTIKEEISKCVVRCANCHRKKTAEDQGWYKQAIEALK